MQWLSRFFMFWNIHFIIVLTVGIELFNISNVRNIIAIISQPFPFENNESHFPTFESHIRLRSSYHSWIRVQIEVSSDCIMKRWLLARWLVMFQKVFIIQTIDVGRKWLRMSCTKTNSDGVAINKTIICLHIHLFLFQTNWHSRHDQCVHSSEQFNHISSLVVVYTVMKIKCDFQAQNNGFQPLRDFLFSSKPIILFSPEVLNLTQYNIQIRVF